MPLGDSITESADGYRGPLFRRLSEDGLDIDFVGSKASAPSAGGDPDHEGRGGHTIGPDESAYCQWKEASSSHVCQSYRFNLYDNLAAVTVQDPDVVLVLLGINDFFPTPMPEPGSDGLYRPVDPMAAAEKLEQLVTALHEGLPASHIVVASLLRVGYSDASTWPGYTALNATARALGTASSDDLVHFADLNAVELVTEDFSDGLHPKVSGGEKVAAAWYAVLRPILGGS
jgi:lysophospholipase L1-like esterase